MQVRTDPEPQQRSKDARHCQYQPVFDVNCHDERKVQAPDDCGEG